MAQQIKLQIYRVVKYGAIISSLIQPDSTNSERIMPVYRAYDQGCCRFLQQPSSYFHKSRYHSPTIGDGYYCLRSSLIIVLPTLVG
jgi:hypothetical protein